MIRQQRQRLPSLHLLTEFDLQLLNLERLRLGLRFPCVCRATRYDDGDFGDELAIGYAVNLRGQQSSIDEFLAVRFDRYFEPSDLAVNLDDSRFRNGTFRRNEPLPLSLGELDILRRFEEVGLREVQRFAEELESKQHLAGSDGVAGNFVNAADDPGNRGDDPAVAETGAVDHDAGNGDRLPEAVGSEWLGRQTQVFLGLCRK